MISTFFAVKDIWKIFKKVIAFVKNLESQKSRTYDTLVLTSVLIFLQKIGPTVHWSWPVYQ